MTPTPVGFTFADLPSNLVDTTMASSIARFSLSPVAMAAVLAFATAAQAQTTTLQPVTITGRGDPVIDVGGWGDVPLSKSPFQASVLSREQMRDLGVQRLADVTRVDPAVSDAYNTEGYWDYLTIRGFVLDNRYNYRRDGLPINAETSIPLANKDSVEIFKGTSGLQAGTAAPGGLANFVVKRPTNDALRTVSLEWRQAGTVRGAVDISQRFGESNAFGVRVNAALEHLDPRVNEAKGNAQLLSVAGDWRIAPDSLLEAEIETSHRSQPSVPGFSLLGGSVPAPVDPRINLNNQPWSLPVVFDGTTASVRFTQRLNADWRVVAHAATQRLTTDDRIAFPYGCGAEGNFDRYCSDGTFDLYDYRSENEKRTTDALQVALNGKLDTGGIAHTLSAGVLRSQFKARFQQQAFNYVGSGNVQGTAVTPADPSLTADSTNRDETSTELFVRDAIKLNPMTTVWLGLRHTHLSRSSVDTSGNSGPSYSQGINTPGIALSHEYAGGQVAYASWGQAVESLVTPGLPAYGTQAGQPLKALKSRQIEIGFKGRFDEGTWNLAWFDIDKPEATDTGTAYFVDGSRRHRGIEANAAWQHDRWIVQGGAQFLHARREGSQDATVNGQRPTNVPAATLKLQARHDLQAVRGLSLQGDFVAESDRTLLPTDGSLRIPGWARIDASLRYAQPTSAGLINWRVGIDNLLDRRAWRESPYQFGHVYLFPLAARTIRVGLELAL
ncbi:TonB-dependent siderophore receptor [Piscinibacter terrae]|nr:TonB-dependent siderophore receptor [Albitalea terrae]